VKFLRPLIFLSFLISCLNKGTNSTRSEIDFAAIEDSVLSLSYIAPEEALNLARSGHKLALGQDKVSLARMKVALGLGLKEVGKQDSAFIQYKEAIILIGNPQTRNEKDILSKALNNVGVLLRSQGQYFKSRNNFLKSLRLRESISDLAGKSRCLINLTAVYKNLNRPDSAFYYGFMSINCLKAAGHRRELGNAWLNIGNSLITLSNDSAVAALRVYRRAYCQYKKSGQTFNLGKCAFSIGNTWLLSKDEMVGLDSARSYYKKAIELFEKSGNQQHTGIVLDALGSIEIKRDELNGARKLFLKSLKACKANNDLQGCIIANIHLSECQFKLGNLDSAKYFIHRSKSKCKTSQTNSLLLDVYDILHRQFIETGKSDSAHYYLNLLHKLKDSLITASTLESAKNSEQQFKNKQLGRKNKQLNESESKARKELSTSYILIAAIIMITVLIIIIYRQRLKSKNQLAAKNEELHQQKLDELMKEKELEKITTLMEGQEQERKRIAGELHDGLGSLLATIKHHFEVVEDKMDTNKETYEKAYGLLDKASEEVRRISHNMASNVLSKFGLVAAMQDLCEVVNASKRLKINLKVTGLENRLESSREIHLFRISQELVSNTLKHAQASAITLQLTMHKDALNLIVEDNGIGFDTKVVKSKEGMGLENLKARVAHLNGTIEIDSVIERGTTVVIDVPI